MSALGLTTRYSLERRTCGCTMHVSATGRFVLAADYDALITRLRAAEARTAWQPIETAPRDCCVIGWADEWERADVAWYGQCLWWTASGSYDQPTHWQPLPAAPEAP